MQQEDLFRSLHESDQLEALVAQLPPLPASVTYFDDFDEKQRTLSNLRTSKVYEIYYCGVTMSADFGRFEGAIENLLKHTFVRLIDRGLTSRNAVDRIMSLLHLTKSEIHELILSTPTTIASIWLKLSAKSYRTGVYSGAKAVLRTLCDHHVPGCVRTA